jgi:hypothetical protein
MGTRRFTESGNTLIIYGDGARTRCDIVENQFGSFTLFPFERLDGGWTRYRTQVSGALDDAMIVVEFPDEDKEAFTGPVGVKFTHFAVYFPKKGDARVMAVKTRRGKQWYLTVPS